MNDLGEEFVWICGEVTDAADNYLSRCRSQRRILPVTPRLRKAVTALQDALPSPRMRLESRWERLEEASERGIPVRQLVEDLLDYVRDLRPDPDQSTEHPDPSQRA